MPETLFRKYRTEYPEHPPDKGGAMPERAARYAPPACGS